MKKSIVSLFAAIMVLGASQVVLADDVASESKAPAPGLVEIQKGAFQSTWANPDVDFSQYQRIIIAPEGVAQYRDVGPAKKMRSRMLHSNEREFGISERDRERIERNANESFVKALHRSKHYEIIDDAAAKVPARGTLVLRSHMLDVVSNVPPPIAGSGSVYSNVMGEATVVIELYDAVSGEMVGFAAERSRIQRYGSVSIDMMPEMNSVSGLAELRRWASRAGMRLAKELDEGHKV